MGTGPVRAEIIAVGSEMLTPDRTDTNSLFVTARLNDVGVVVQAKSVVRDDLAAVSVMLREALARADVVILTGGLGPTDDDVTRDAAALALGRPLVEHGPTLQAIRARFASRGLTMPEINRRQARLVEHALPLENRQGTAPGQWIDLGSQVVVLLPGPPREMQPLCEAVAARLAERTGGAAVFRRSLRLVGHTESHAEERLQPLYARWTGTAPPVTATILAARGEIELQLSCRSTSADDASAVLDTAVAEVAAAFGDDLYARDGRRLEEVVGDLLRARAFRVALAESCTGGLVTSRLTDVAGSSDYVERGVVAYSNRAKTDLLGVPEPLIAEHGAVSEAVALAMADGVRRLAGCDIGLGLTGIAGPGGGSDAKPVGTVAVAVCGPGSRRSVRTWRFPGGRTLVKLFASTAALDALRRAMLGGG